VTPADLRLLLAVLEEFGVSHYQTPDLTLTLDRQPKKPHVLRPGEEGNDPEVPFELPELDEEEEAEAPNYLARIASANFKKRGG
jgi:hypothetical protein